MGETVVKTDEESQRAGENFLKQSKKFLQMKKLEELEVTVKDFLDHERMKRFSNRDGWRYLLRDTNDGCKWIQEKVPDNRRDGINGFLVNENKSRRPFPSERDMNRARGRLERRDFESTFQKMVLECKIREYFGRLPLPFSRPD